MIFEFVEVLVIGSPTRAGLIMQLLYFLIGTVMVLVVLSILYIDANDKRIID